jgi:soluble lytic murein transglycosylase-like protein
VRIGKLNLGGFGSIAASRWSQRFRKAASVLALVASVAALALIVETQYGGLWFGQSEARASSRDALPAADASTDAADPVTTLAPDEEGRYRALSEFVARRYRVSQDVAFDLVSHAHTVGRQLQLDPLLIIAVIAIESRFNPIAESVAGAKGLMQIIPKYHGDKLEEFGGAQAVFDPETNIQVGSKILREYIRRTGNLGMGLQMYAGALGDNEDQYTRKVLNERARLQQVLSPRAAERPSPAVAERPAPPVAVRTASVLNRNSLVLPPDLD